MPPFTSYRQHENISVTAEMNKSQKLRFADDIRHSIDPGKKIEELIPLPAWNPGYRKPFHYAHMFREALVKDIARQLLAGANLWKHWRQLGDPRGSSGCADLLRRGVAFAAELYRAKVILPTGESFRACLLLVILNSETIRAPGDLDVTLAFVSRAFKDDDVLFTQGSWKLVESIRKGSKSMIELNGHLRPKEMR
ncbi:hypothetical protein DFP72DRAFT_848872 [Ephemerocybe angulata]|uniref:Uncharacterized protein n=1 Tax=Ephemerocybe angulata TaxID=980116 RepID=A0A8H6HUR6_9AGAR|nr:hypothetical protein DFP72DRAFT_848872 [Tulosesus angulatus]